MCDFSHTLLPDERIDRINDRLLLIQKKNGLTFGTDAYLLSAFAKPAVNEIAFDLGCGTGVTTLLCMARNKYKKMYSVEIQKEFAVLAKRNFELNGLGETCEIIGDDVRNASAFPSVGIAKCVISNPPYMPINAGITPQSPQLTAARREENGTIFDFCAAAEKLLKHGGFFYTVYRPDRVCDLIAALKRVSLEPKRMIFVYPDVKSAPCLVLTEAKKGAAPSVKISRPLIIYENTDKNKERKYTEDMNRIYGEFTLDFLFEKKK